MSIDKTDISGTITRNPEMHHRAPGQARDAGVILGYSTAEQEPGLRAMSRSTIETKVSDLVTRGRDRLVSFHVHEWARVTPECGRAGLEGQAIGTLQYSQRLEYYYQGHQWA